MTGEQEAPRRGRPPKAPEAEAAPKAEKEFAMALLRDYWEADASSPTGTRRIRRGEVIHVPASVAKKLSQAGVAERADATDFD